MSTRCEWRTRWAEKGLADFGRVRKSWLEPGTVGAVVHVGYIRRDTSDGSKAVTGTVRTPAKPAPSPA